jgi:hypothetical protein
MLLLRTLVVSVLLLALQVPPDHVPLPSTDFPPSDSRVQQNTSPGSSLTPLAKDVSDIRDLAFRPNGDGVHVGSTWDSYSFSDAPARFVIVNPEVSVKHADGTIERVTLRHAPAGGDSAVLLLNADQILVLGRMMTKLGGPKRRPPADIMEVPNQPVGQTLDILAFWNEFFPARTGHWEGWVFASYPIITEIAFVDAARTAAGAHVTIGYSGATVMLEMKNGIWQAVGLTGYWAT